MNFVEGLYESEAEILSDGWNDVDCECLEGVLGETAFYDTGHVACLIWGSRRSQYQLNSADTVVAA